MVKLFINFSIMKVLTIKSKNNEKIRCLRKLKQKKYRSKYSSFFVENFKIILDATLSNIYCESLFVSSAFINKNKDKLDLILKKGKIKQYYLIDESINRSFSDLEVPSGICAIYCIKQRKRLYKLS